ncbi:acyclic terpene utilization AtuA family protein [Actinocorallia longicatena]
MQPRDPLRIGNASGFYGDRFSAVREMLEDGPLDVLTGDYLAELTMLILGRGRMKDPGAGYASAFVRQMEESLGLAVENGTKIVTNAGGLNPAGLAAKLRELAERLGLEVSIAHVEGDDLLPRAGEFGFGRTPYGPPLTSNAYLGAWGIVECLNAGADVVVTGRVTDASLVIGPAAAHFGWARDDWDALAGATVAGHVLECGPQATGGNYAFFAEEIYNVKALGFPLAEIHADGSSVITKHPGTGGVVSTGTVTAQLLYEIQGHRYLGPDVTTRFDSIELAQDGRDRVRISGVRGEAPPDSLKVCNNHLGGVRNEVVFVLTGLDLEAKEKFVREQFEASLQRRPQRLEWSLIGRPDPEATDEAGASALLRGCARDADPAVVGRPFSAAAIELALASYPGFHLTAPPGNGSPFGVYLPAYVPNTVVVHTAVLPDGSRREIEPSITWGGGAGGTPVEEPPGAEAEPPGPPGPARTVPLGRVAGARSGDKGGDGNIGVWVDSEERWRWLHRTLTVERLRELLPDIGDLAVERHAFPRLRALNFVIEGVLQEGVSASTKFDPQGKGLGEWLRSRPIDIPESLL